MVLALLVIQYCSFETTNAKGIKKITSTTYAGNYNLRIVGFITVNYEKINKIK